MSLATADFEFIADLVRRRSAIVLEPGKEYLVETRLMPVARKMGAPSLEALVAELRGSGRLHAEVIEAMTTNETHFFRDISPWELLSSRILPPLIEARRTRRQLTFWCAACSSGQEPYTVAMLLRRDFPALADWDVTILATDISTEMLERTRAGRYTQLEVNRGLPAQLLVRWFTKDGADWVIAEDLRRMVRTSVHNLAERWPPGPPVDVMFLRNVLIYFDVETRKRILEQAAGRLAPDGALFLGGAETTLNITDRFDRIPDAQSSVYRLRRQP